MAGNDAYTKLLIHSDDTDGSTTIVDSSASAHAITVNGDVHHEIDQAKFGASSLFLMVFLTGYRARTLQTGG